MNTERQIKVEKKTPREKNPYAYFLTISLYYLCLCVLG